MLSDAFPLHMLWTSKGSQKISIDHCTYHLRNIAIGSRTALVAMRRAPANRGGRPPPPATPRSRSRSAAPPEEAGEVEDETPQRGGRPEVAAFPRRQHRLGIRGGSARRGRGRGQSRGRSASHLSDSSRPPRSRAASSPADSTPRPRGRMCCVCNGVESKDSQERILFFQPPARGRT